MSEEKLPFTYEELMLAVQESLELLKQKPDMTKFYGDLNKATNDYLKLLGMKPHNTVFDEIDDK